jgi:type I restriction enzyme M protein
MNENNKILKQGYIEDYISGQQVQDTPEEIEAVQVFARQLVEDYGYSKDQIQTRPQWRVKSRPSDLKGYPVDIVVFKSEKKTEDNILIVVECKKLNRKDGRSQLENYLTFSKAYLGVWFNGEDRLFLRKIEKEGKVHFEEIVNIPRKEEDFESIGKFRRKDLTIPHNLKAVFKVIRNHLAGNAVGTTRDQTIAQELINLIFCKIYDEKFTKQNDLVRFRTGAVEKAEDVQSRILELFGDVKREYQDVLDFSDEITLDKNSIKFIVGELQNYCLIDSERDVIADAFEVFIGKALKGEHGQFFTPRNVVKLMVEFIDPDISSTIIDPACGSGGFLIEGLRYLWRKIDERGKEYGWSQLTVEKEKMAVAENSMRGLEIDSFLAKVAKAYMAIIGDGKSGIFCEDSLEMPKNWQSMTRNKIGLEKFDTVITNPPFGDKIKIVGDSKLAQYDLAREWKYNDEKDNWEFRNNKVQKAKSPEILFIERIVGLLKDGGRAGVVLPEGIFGNPTDGYVWEFLSKNVKILSVISLPSEAFQPHTHFKTSILFFEKTKPSPDDEILFGIANTCGHDKNGKVLYKLDNFGNPIEDENGEKIIDDDILEIANKARSFFKKEKFENTKKLFTILNKEVKHNVFIPDYYDLDLRQELNSLDKYEAVSIGDLVSKNVLKITRGHEIGSKFYGTGKIPFVRTSDIVNWEIDYSPTKQVSLEAYNLFKKKQDIQKDDILFVSDGTFLIGRSAIITDLDTQIVIQSHLKKIRVLDTSFLSPYYLLYLLNTELVQKQIQKATFIQGTISTINNRIKDIILPIHKDKKIIDDITNKMKQIIDDKKMAKKVIRKIPELYFN